METPNRSKTMQGERIGNGNINGIKKVYKAEILRYDVIVMATQFKDFYTETGLVDLGAVAKGTGVPLRKLAAFAGVTERRLRDNPAAPKAQSRAREFVSILRDLTRLLGDSKEALIWLRDPQPELEDHVPLELILEGKTQAVKGLVRRLATGEPA